MPETRNYNCIEFLESVADYLNELIDILYEKEYFSNIENAKQYVSDMKNYVEQNIQFLPKKLAPFPFTKYGKNMQYITYNANKRTTWYFFFQQKGNRYLIRYVTNNHVDGQYIR
jgi:hypothetical protein